MTAAEDEPVHLVEDAETGDRFLVYKTDKGPRLDIRYAGETLWMTQAQIGQLLGVDRSVITRHIANIYDERELEAEATSAKIAQVRHSRPGERGPETSQIAPTLAGVSKHMDSDIHPTPRFSLFRCAPSCGQLSVKLE